MSSNIQLRPLEINFEKRRQIILENIVRMLTNRKMLNENDLTKNIETLVNTESDDLTYKLKLVDERVFYVKLLSQKITGISKTSLIGEFLNLYKSYPKIIVVSSVTSNAIAIIKNDYIDTEIFLEKELMIDIVQHIAVPKHELLSEEESKKVLDAYLLRKKQVPKIFVTDPISKYFNAKPGNIFRISGPSPTAVLSIRYRLVVKGNISNYV